MHDFYSASKKSGINEKELWEIERKTFDNFFKNLDLISIFSPPIIIFHFTKF